MSPHILSMTEIEFNSKSHRVENLGFSPVVADVHETTATLPISKRDTPVAGAIWTGGWGFDYWVSGSGSAGTAPPMDKLLLACGLNESVSAGVSVTYLSTGDLDTDLTRVNLDMFIGDGLKVPVPNAVGNMSMAFRPGEPVKMRFDFEGTYTAPTEAAGAASLVTAAHPPAAKGLTATVGGDTLVLKEVDTSLNNVNNSPNYDAVAANGVANPDLTDTAPDYSFLAVLPAFATANYWTDFLAETKTDLSVVLGGTAGNIMTLTASGYPLGPPDLTDVNGILQARMNYRVGWGSGDTKWTAVFT